MQEVERSISKRIGCCGKAWNSDVPSYKHPLPTIRPTRPWANALYGSIRTIQGGPSKALQQLDSKWLDSKSCRKLRLDSGNCNAWLVLFIRIKQVNAYLKKNKKQNTKNIKTVCIVNGQHENGDPCFIKQR